MMGRLSLTENTLNACFAKIGAGHYLFFVDIGVKALSIFCIIIIGIADLR